MSYPAATCGRVLKPSAFLHLVALIVLQCAVFEVAASAQQRVCSYLHHGESPFGRDRKCSPRTVGSYRSQRKAPTFQANGLVYSLRDHTQTIADLKAAGSGLSYVPTDGMFNVDRTMEWVRALGDITFRVRPADRWLAELPFPAGLHQYPEYVNFTTAAAGPSNAVVKLPNLPGQYGAANLTGCLSKDPRYPLQVLRWYEQPEDSVGGLRMVFEITNRDPYVALDVGGLSAAMPFQGRTDGIKLVDLPKTTVMVDAYVGLHHGYATVTPASGRGPVLVVLGENGTAIEGWATDFEDVDSTILGTPEWIIHSAAYQEDEWKASDGPWNVPTRKILQPQESMRVVLRLAVAPGVRAVDDLLTSAGKVVVKGVPGYVCSTSFQTAKLMLKLPAGLTVTSWTSEPDGMLNLGSPTQPGRWTVFPVGCTGYGRTRLTITYSDGSLQTVHYFVLGDFKEHVDRFGRFQASTAWLPREARDPFGRSASVMPWDSQAGKHVLHDSRAFVVGLSDEAGAGANVGLAIKAQHSPSMLEAQRLDEYINSTLWGVKQPPEVPFAISLQDHATHGIRASLFYVPNPAEGTDGMPGYQYLPGDTSGWIWGRNYVNALGRAYNYPHQIVSYWSMYRIARNYELLQFSQPAAWYLEQAGRTVLGMWAVARWYTQMGLMAGTVFEEVLADLKREGMQELAQGVEAVMYNRTAVGITYLSRSPCDSQPPDPFTCVCTNLTKPTAAGSPAAAAEVRCPPWRGHPFPFGSEFAWDTTGQEEVYVWSRFFDFRTEAQIAVDAILAFMPGMPHWAYNGAALGMGDFSNNAKWTFNGGWERVLCHYRAGLNNIPVMREWLRDPSDTYLLGVAAGALAAHVTNINQQGAARMGFHADPSILQHDPYSGDFGVGFFGHSLLSGSYLTYGHMDSTWLCYFCDVFSLQPLKQGSQNKPTSLPNFLNSPTLDRPLSGAEMSAFWNIVEVEGARDAWGYTGGDSPVRIVPRDSYHRRLYIQTLELQLLLLNARIVNADLYTLSVVGKAALMVLNVTTADFPHTTRLRLLLESTQPPTKAHEGSHADEDTLACVAPGSFTVRRALQVATILGLKFQQDSHQARHKANHVQQGMSKADGTEGKGAHAYVHDVPADNVGAESSMAAPSKHNQRLRDAWPGTGPQDRLFEQDDRLPLGRDGTGHYGKYSGMQEEQHVPAQKWCVGICGVVQGGTVRVVSGVVEVEAPQPAPPYIQLLVCSF